MTTTRPTGPPKLDGIADELRDLWRTRPERLREQGKIAGVAEGIGRRYDVDPLLVRIAFVVSALFGGAGVWLYIACWLTFPSPRQPYQDPAVYGYPYGVQGYPPYPRPPFPHPAAWGRPDKPRNRFRARNIALLGILGLVAVSTLPATTGRGSAGLLGAVLMLGALYLLYRRRPRPAYAAPAPHTAGAAAGPVDGPAQPAPPGSGPSADTGNSGVRDEAAAEGAVGDAGTGGAATPPEWDPLGAAPFAWDLPTPPPQPAPAAPKKRRSRLTMFTIGSALIAAAVASGVSVAGADWLTAPRIAAVALAVVGAGLVVGAFLRTGYGLLIVAAPLAGFVILGSLAVSLDTSGGVGQREFHPTTLAQLQPEYRVGAGEILLDLRSLDLTADTTVDVSSTVGRVEVIVPDAMRVEANCHTTVGDSSCLPDAAAAPRPGQPGDSPLLTLNADSTLGEVVVRHG
ncbi:PspC domain-containing protein [Tomitella cavernea]|uniref:Phage shock protein PspC N-terminal domain-containing protein n=1 Tax=Tomitella cavernea TaxID=1387982 RepID=A0ABP9CEY5_9ACTN|nr:PspC domain-containing protein [Tomitella cavernea]